MFRILFQVGVEPLGKRRGSGAPASAARKRKNSVVPISKTDNKDGTHTVRYEPTCAGPHAISVTLDGKEVPQSPVR